MAKQKGISFAILAVIAIVQGALREHYAPEPTPEWIVWLLVASVSSAVYLWYRADSTLRGQARALWLSILVTVLPLVGIPIYLFKSRGLPKGILGLLGAIAVFVAFIFFSGSASIALAYFTGKPL